MAPELIPLGERALRSGHDVLARLELIRISDRMLARLVTYDARMRAAAADTGLPVAAPR